MKRKRLTVQTVTGQEGINLIERIVFAIGSIWNVAAELQPIDLDR